MVQARARQLLAARRAEADRKNPIKFANDPAGFVRVILREHLWSKQVEIVESVRDNRRTAVQSCHDSGKSFVASRIVSWFLSTIPVGDGFVVTSAPTAAQVRAILWREIGRAHARGNLPGRVNMTEWIIGKELVAFGRKPDDMDMTGFQGIHARRVLVVLDEACGIPKALWDAAETLITNDEARILAIGNPDDPASGFAQVCKPGSGWNVIRIDGLETPNFTGEEVPDALRPLLLGKSWVEEKRTSWGEDSPLWIAKVRGEFPDIADNGLISARDLRAAIDRELEPSEPNELGVDVARFGKDETAIYRRRGPVARLHGVLNKRDLMSVVGFIVEAVRTTGARRVKVDDAGLGGGVTDRLREIVREAGYNDGVSHMAGVEIVAINVGEGPTDRVSSDDGRPAKERFKNLRAELFWALRDRFVSGDIDLGDDDDTSNQAQAIRYDLNSRGQIQIESKEDMRKRGLSSPDRLDALMLVFSDTATEIPIVIAGNTQESSYWAVNDGGYVE